MKINLKFRRHLSTSSRPDCGPESGGREDTMLEDNVMVSADKWLDTNSEWWQLPEPIKTINFHLITKTIRLAVSFCKLCVDVFYVFFNINISVFLQVAHV